MNCHWCKGWAFHLCFLKIGVFQLNPHNRKWFMLGLQMQLFNFYPWVSCTSHHFIQQISFEIPSNSTTRSRTRPPWVPPAWAPRWRRWPRRSGGIRPQQRWRASVPRKVVFPTFEVVSEQYDFSKCCWKRCCCYLYIVCISICIFLCMCICTYIRTHDMCTFMSAWPRAWSIYCWKGLVWWLAILEDPMGYQSPGAPTNLPSKSLDKNRAVFLMSYPSHPNKNIPSIDGPHILHQLNRWNN